MYLTDKTLQCSDCSTQFAFSVAEQEFYQQKGFSEPRRCKPCRDAAKAARNSGGGMSRGPAPRSREMFDVTCAGCGVQTQVPFKPSGARPVYCRDCFQR